MLWMEGPFSTLPQTFWGPRTNSFLHFLHLSSLSFYKMRISNHWCLSKAEANRLLKYSSDEEPVSVLGLNCSRIISIDMMADVGFEHLKVIIWLKLDIFFPITKLQFSMSFGMSQFKCNISLSTNLKCPDSNQFNKIVFLLQNTASWNLFFHSPASPLGCISCMNHITEVNALNPPINIHCNKTVHYRRYFGYFGHRPWYIRFPIFIYLFPIKHLPLSRNAKRGWHELKM